MNKIKVLLTAVGAPGASTLIRMLKNNGEREIEIVGTDMDPQPIGRFLCDKFYQVPAGDHPGFIPSLLDIIEDEYPDVVFPESSNEVYEIALNKNKLERTGVTVLISHPNAIARAMNKYEMYQVLRDVINVHKYRYVHTLTDFLKAIDELGYPDNAVVFKPPVSKGSRGFRIIDPKVDRKRQLLYEKPTAKYISLDEFTKIFEGNTNFPELLVMEYLEGEACDCNTLAMDGKELLTDVKTREQDRWGVIVKGELVQRDELVEQIRKILKKIKLSYCVNFQFIGDKLVEINPRVSSFIYQKELIVPYLAIKLALGEIEEGDIIAMRDKMDYGRRMIRYMDQIFYKENV